MFADNQAAVHCRTSCKEVYFRGSELPWPVVCNREAQVFQHAGLLFNVVNDTLCQVE